MGSMSAISSATGMASSAIGAIGNYVASYYSEKQQSEQYAVRAKNARTMAEQEIDRAGQEQIKGEQEAAKRSRLLASDIGSAYANWAGNGLSVSGNATDTFGSILKTTTAEGVSDIDTIKDNAAMNVWGHMNDAAYYTADAKNYDAVSENLNDSANFRLKSSAALLALAGWTPEHASLVSMLNNGTSAMSYQGYKG